MKRCCCVLIILLLLVTEFPLNTFATVNAGKNTQIVYFEDGSSLTIGIQIPEIQLFALMPKTASKFATYKDSSGVEQWKATLTGTFAYDGTYSTCSASNWNVTIFNNEWSVVSKVTSKTGNTATGELVINRKVVGIKVDEETVSLSITCDQHGNIS